VGVAAFLSNFCALGGVADILFAKDWRRMRTWMLAAGVALIGTQALDAMDIIHVDRILAPYILWLPTLLGGTLFGFGMALSGGCVNRALVRVGAGSFKSFVIVLVVGLTAAITMTGFLAPLGEMLARAGRVDVLIAPEALHRIVGSMPTFDPEAVRWIMTGLIGGGLITFCLKDAWFRASREQMAAGILIGTMIPVAWLASDSTQAINFVAPLGDAMMALHRDAPVFGMMTILGVPMGSFAAAALTRNLAFETFSVREEIPRNVVGAMLMGFGGSIALGGTFGQGLSGFSTLSISAFLTIAGILFGCLWGIRYFEAGGVWRGLKLTLRRGA
jgi:uncharacterized protein